MAELIKETEWSRRYFVSPTSIRYESKFLVDGLTVKVNELISRWESLTESEQHDFALAFQCKGKLSADDEKILLFLMQAGDEIIWRTVSLMLCRHTDREHVVRFLLERLQDSVAGRSNYYQAAETIGDPKFLPILERHFREYRTRITERGHQSAMLDGDWLEYLELSNSLRKLTGGQDYEQAVAELSKHSSELVRSRAHDYLRQSGDRRNRPQFSDEALIPRTPKQKNGSSGRNPGTDGTDPNSN